MGTIQQIPKEYEEWIVQLYTLYENFWILLTDAHAHLTSFLAFFAFLHHAAVQKMSQ